MNLNYTKKALYFEYKTRFDGWENISLLDAINQANYLQENMQTANLYSRVDYINSKFKGVSFWTAKQR